MNKAKRDAVNPNILAIIAVIAIKKLLFKLNNIFLIALYVVYKLKSLGSYY